MKVFYCSAFFFLAAINITFAQSGCDPRVNYSVREKSQSTYSIYLTSKSPIANGELILHDLYTGKSVQSKFASLTTRETEVFTGLKSSRYVVYIRQAGCNRPKSVGGAEGIKVGNIE